MRRLLGLFPHKGLPSGSLALDETNVQVPTSCSLSDFCCATAGSANPSQIAVVKTMMSAVRRFIVLPLWFGVRAWQCLRLSSSLVGISGMHNAHSVTG